MAQLTGWLLRWYGPFLWLLLAAWVGILISSLKELRAAFGPALNARSLAIGSVLFAGALLVRLFVYPHTHQVYFDEFEHLDIARNLARLGQFSVSRVSGIPGYDVLDAPIWPGGYHALLALVFKLFGFSETAAYSFNAILGAKTVALVFLIALAAFQDSTAAGLSAFFWAALPLNLKYSAATDLTIASLVWIETALLALILWRRSRSPRPGLLCLLAAVYAAHTRPENLLLLPFLALAAPTWDRRSVAWAGAGLLLLVPVGVVLGSNAASGIPGYAGSAGPGPEHMVEHLHGNLAFLLKSPSSLLLLLPAFGAALERRRLGLWLAALGAAYFAVYSAYHLGAFSVDSGDRYALPVLLPAAALAGWGFKRLLERLPGGFAGTIVLGWAFIAASWPSYGALSNERYEAEYRLIKEAASLLPPETYVVSFSPAAILTAARRPSASPFAVLADDHDPAFSRLAAQQEWVVFRDYWWRIMPDTAHELMDRFEGYREEPLLTRRIDGADYGFWRYRRISPDRRPAAPK